MKKVLLTRFTRAKKGGKEGETETLMPNGTAYDLSAEDIKTLDNLTAVTGKRYYRDPINESATEDERADDDSGVELTEAEQFVNRNVGDISDDEIAALSAEDRAAAHAAETAGKGRATLLARLAPAAEEKDEGL